MGLQKPAYSSPRSMERKAICARRLPVSRAGVLIADVDGEEFEKAPRRPLSCHGKSGRVTPARRGKGCFQYSQAGDAERQRRFALRLIERCQRTARAQGKLDVKRVIGRQPVVSADGLHLAHDLLQSRMVDSRI